MYPHLPILFSGSGVISKKELKLFYTAFLDAGKLDDIAVAELTNKSYEAMTSNGEVQLSFHMYKLSFLNFLLGKQPNGPGQWLFGQVDREDTGNGQSERFLIDSTLLTKEEVKDIESIVGVDLQKDRKPEEENDIVENTVNIFPTKIICTNDNEVKTDVEKIICETAENSEEKESLETIGSGSKLNVHRDVDKDAEKGSESNLGIPETTSAHDTVKEARESAEKKKKAKHDRRSKTDQESKKKERDKDGRTEKEFSEKKKESSREKEELDKLEDKVDKVDKVDKLDKLDKLDKVRMKRVEVTSKKSILV